MTKTITLAALAAMLAVPVAVPAPALAQHQDDRDANGRDYHGNDGDYHYRCKKSKGTTGTIAGAVGGGLAGNLLGGGTVGTLAGAGGGALLGRHLDKKHDQHQNRENGC
ncbi:glycine zipper 2TM domain-containing protein [Sphingomonas abietis]|uniref:Glycine zipper 2TM domain-containing protein n=1 Tax=Sphingomonas abietis TaxID=3012344 RepID=A0ABY7NLU5_9SPHN|nr:glycine zipper 2TM domain-containing protein [Sphingomonas abietis]WBO21598.1 glycine zipper 2TM domain-containing protein [Sphingomonas abietis]